MYAAGPINLHIICDESARRFIERRLERLKHPEHDVAIFFYDLTWQSIVDRLNREGSMWSTHSAGAGMFIASIMEKTKISLTPTSSRTVKAFRA